MYTVSTTPGGRVDAADTIPNALAAFASQLTAQLPDGPVAWNITDPDGTEHRGRATLGSRIDLLTIFVDEIIDDLYSALHRAADHHQRQMPACVSQPIDGRSGAAGASARPAKPRH